MTRALVSVTRLRLRSWRHVPGFLLGAAAALSEVRRAPGFLGGGVLVDRRLTFWTVTRWRDAASMRAWQGRGAHGRAMPRLAGWCDEASVVRWEGDGAPPGWSECHARMVAEGRPTPVRRPSAVHAAGRIPPPREGRVRSLAVRAADHHRTDGGPSLDRHGRA